MKILSLFDGMSCGQIALNRCGIPLEKYYASEVDKFAIKITQKNFPDTIQIGDVLKVKAKNLPKIDLLMAGSPCQGFSFSGKGLNFDDPRSKLFFEFFRLLKECKPRWWLLENVFMKKEYSRAISNLLGVYPVLINSADFSAQNRQRYYWTNIPYNLFWSKSKVVLEDILEPVVDEKYFIDSQRAIKILDKETERGRIGVIGKGGQGGRIYSIHGKSIAMNSSDGGLGVSTGLYAMPVQGIDRLNKPQPARQIKLERSKSFIINEHPNRRGVLILQKGRGNNPGGIKAKNGKTPALTGSRWEQNNYLFNGRIRRLTPIECERLQTVDDNYSLKGLETHYQALYNDVNENYTGEIKCKESAKSKNVINQSQIGKLNSAINTIIDSLGTEQLKSQENLLIKAGFVLLKGAKINSKQLRISASNIIKNGRENNQLINQKNVKFVVTPLETGRAECVLSIMGLGLDIKTLYIPSQEDINHMEIKEENIIKIQMVNGLIKLLQKKNLKESCEKGRLFTMLTLINLIITRAIFLCVKQTQITSLCIDSLSMLRENLLEMGLLSFKMENIVEISNTARYRMLGNGFTVDVVAYLLKGILNGGKTNP